jgi:serine/threonine protein kinase
MLDGWLELLGEGTFASVVTCCSRRAKDVTAADDAPQEFAVKIISKNVVKSFNAIKRLSEEIETIKALKSPLVINYIDCVQTEDNLFIFMEKGGRDLFDFCSEHLETVDEGTTRKIISGILQGVNYCHSRGICHR